MPNISHREFALALSLTATAGFLDAVGFLNLGGYFISFMTGNTTRLSAELVEHSGAGIGKALSIIGLFLVGTVIGSVASRFGDGRVTVLGATAAVVGLSAVSSALDGFPVPAIMVAAVAMGMLNATFVRDGEVSVGLTYMTGTLVKAGQRFADVFFDGPRWGWVRPLSQWLSLAFGAMFGAWAYTRIGLTVLWFVFAWLCLATLVTWIVRSDRFGQGVWHRRRQRA